MNSSELCGIQKTKIVISCILAFALSSPIYTEDSPADAESQAAVRAASVVFCNQSDVFLLDDINACLGQIKESLGFPSQGRPDAHGKLDIIQSKLEDIDTDISRSDASLCTKLMRVESKVDDLAQASCVFTLIDSLPFVITMPGLYALGSNLTWNNNGSAITISANNVVLDLGCYELAVVSGSSTRNGILISGGKNITLPGGAMRLIQSGSAETNLIETSNATDITIKNMSFMGPLNTSNTFRHVHLNAGSSNLLVTNCSFLGSAFGVDCDGVTQIRISKSLFKNISSDHVILHDASEDIDVHDCQFFLGGTHISLRQLGANTGARHVTISNCRHESPAQTSGTFGVIIDNSIGAIIKDCCMIGAGVIDEQTFVSGVDGYMIENSENVTIARCVIQKAARWGININSNCDNVKTFDCSVSNANLAGGGGGIADPSSGKFVVGSCVTNTTPAFFGVSAALIASGIANIASANNRWINVNFP